MPDELKPCPYCGKNEITANPYPDIYGCPSCDYCGSRVPYGILEEQIKLWNSRPIEDTLKARIAELEAEGAVITDALEKINNARDKLRVIKNGRQPKV